MLQDFVSFLCFGIPVCFNAMIVWEGCKNISRDILGESNFLANFLHLKAMLWALLSDFPSSSG